MKRLITAAQILVVITIVTSLARGTDYIIQYNEKMIGAGHPTLADTLNRGFLIDHDADGTHEDNVIAPAKLQSSSGTAGGTTYYRGDGAWGTPSGAAATTTLPWDNITSRPTINSVTVTGAVLDNASNYPTFNQNTTGTAAALTANGANCTSGQAPLGVDASGAVESCWTPGNMLASTYDANSDNVVESAIATAITDNLIVNADVNSAAAIDATKIADGTVTSAEFQYLGDVTSEIQGQLDLKSPIASPTFTGTVAAPKVVIAGTGGGTIDNTVIGGTTPAAGTFTTITYDEGVSSAADNTHYWNAANTADPTGADLAIGNAWYNKTSKLWKFRTFDNTATGEFFTSEGTNTLNFATSGTLTGGIMILDNVVSPTAAQVYGSWNTITTAGTVTLPAAVEGMSTCIATEGALEITLELDGSDTFVLNGVTMDAGEAIINTTAEAAGDYICVIATSAVKWRVAGKQGTWTQATP